MKSVRSVDSLRATFSYGTCTYDGDDDNDSFQTAACSMYSGFRFLHAITDDETVDAERVNNTEDKASSEGLLSFEDKYSMGDELRAEIDDDDENLSYISDIEGEECRDRTFFFTTMKNTRLDIAKESSLSLMSLDTASITLDAENIPDIDSITTRSTLLHQGIMGTSSLTLSHGPHSISADWFATMALAMVRTRDTKFRSIPIRSTFLDLQLYQKIEEEYESSETESMIKELATLS